jgi:hypothetical protein
MRTAKLTRLDLRKEFNEATKMNFKAKEERAPKFSKILTLKDFSFFEF